MSTRTYGKIPIRVTIQSRFITHDLAFCVSSLISVPHFLHGDEHARVTIGNFGCLYSVIQNGHPKLQ